MKIIYKIIFGLLTVLSCLVIYYNTNSYMSKYWWKHYAGESVGDYLEFDNLYMELRGDSIYRGKEEIGSVFLCIADKMIIRSKDGGKFCVYIAKN